MPAFKPVSQKNWKRGLVANTPEQDQPPDSLARVSNLLYTRRGGLRTCDGSLIISALNGAVQPVTGPWTELFLFQPNQVSRYYIGIKKDYTTHLGAPTGLAVADGGAGGVLVNATYRYKVTALDGAGGETIASAEVNFANPGAHKASATWTAVANASGGYNVYRTAAGGAVNTEVFLTTVTTNAFIDDGSITPGTAAPPGVDTTQTCPLFRVPATSYSNANLLATFPADPIVPADGTPGGRGGGGGTTNPSSGGPPNPQGGNTGNLSPTPMIVQFANKAIIAPGNGFAPQLVADTIQPDWTTLTQFNAGSVIKPLTNNAGGFYFIATTGGTTAAGNPVFPQTVGATVADANITWKNINTPPVAALFNTFQAIYPDWVAAQVFAVGDKIKPSVSNPGGFVFQCMQAGTAGAGPVTWPQSQNQTITDPKLLWQNIGQGVNSPAPRGASHFEVYAGALWALNTNPITTVDNLDGPSALRMSDINNPISWNPLNTAFIDRDDGDQGTGLKAMTIAESGIPPTGSLVAFKNFKTFQINGVFGSSNFSIQRAQTDMGCIASRTIEFCPGFGIIRMTHLGFALFDTTRDRVISEAIRPFLFKDTQISDISTLDWNFAYFSKAAQCADPPMYMCAVPLALANVGNVSVTLINGGAIPVGTYFVVVTKFTLLSGVLTESAISTEFTLTVSVSRLIQATLTSPDPAVVKYRFYIGTESRSYTAFADVLPTAFPVTFNFAGQDPGAPGFPNSGSPSVGTGGLTRIFCYDLVQKAWAIIDLPFSISVLRQVRPPGSEPITIVGGFNDGTMRRIQAGDPDWDGTRINWSFRPAELMGLGGTERVFYHRLGIRGVTNDTVTLSSLAVTPVYDGTADVAQTPVNYTFGNGRFASWAELIQTALTMHASVNGTGVIEIDALDYDVEPLPLGTPPQFA